MLFGAMHGRRGRFDAFPACQLFIVLATVAVSHNQCKTFIACRHNNNTIGSVSYNDNTCLFMSDDDIMAKSSDGGDKTIKELDIDGNISS